MDLIRSVLTFGFQACPSCGGYRVQESLLCVACEENVFRLLNPRVETLEGWTIRSLFSWNPGESDALSALLLALKGPHRRRAWKFWAEVFSRHHFGSFGREGAVHAVSAPLRGEKSSWDHAAHWTEALSAEHGFLFRGPLFRKSGEQSQRRKSHKERRSGLKLVKMTDEPQDSSASWVFGDDILTTGETARAVHRALGRPFRFEVWCLARRGMNPPRADV